MLTVFARVKEAPMYQGNTTRYTERLMGVEVDQIRNHAGANKIEAYYGKVANPEKDAPYEDRVWRDGVWLRILRCENKEVNLPAIEVGECVDV